MAILAIVCLTENEVYMALWKFHSNLPRKKTLYTLLHKIFQSYCRLKSIQSETDHLKTLLTKKIILRPLVIRVFSFSLTLSTPIPDNEKNLT